MRRRWLVALVAVVAVVTAWSGGRVIERTSGVQATTTSVVVETIPPPVASPIPFPDLQPPPPPPGVPATPPGGGEAVTFDVVVATTSLACCGVVLQVGDDASFDGGGGLACLPSDAAGRTTATFRWTHFYERSARFTLSVLARAGTCSDTPGTGGLTAVIEVT